MESELPEFSSSQWAFLAFLEASAEPVSIDLAGLVTPILPGEFLDLLARCERLGWLQKDGTKVLRLVRDLPREVRDKIQEINTREHLLSFVDRMETLDLRGQTDRVIMANLLSRCGRDKDAAFLETELAQKALSESNSDQAATYLNRAITRLEPGSDDVETDALFISNVLLLSRHYFTLDPRLEALPSLLNNTGNRAERMGDRRSSALLKLHRGRFLNFAGKSREALSSLSAGLEELARINDIELQAESVEFLGVYCHIQGLYKEAFEHFERARESFEAQEKGQTISPVSMVYRGYSAAYAGQYERSVGTFDYYWRLYREKTDRPLACIMRAALGTVLLMLKKNDEASFHLHQALDEAVKTNSTIGLYLSRGGLSYLHYLEGREREAYELTTQSLHQAAESGIRHYTSPFVLEMLFAFDRLGFEPVPGFSLESEIERIHGEPNIHLRGVALRLQAKQGFAKGRDGALLRSYLEKSEEYLKRSGDPTELAKTRLEMARLSLDQGDMATARSLAQQARQGLSGNLEELFPDDLRNLLETLPSYSEHKSGRDYLFRRFLDLMDGLVPHTNPELTLTRIVAATNRFLAAERGGLFWFGDRKSRNVRLRVGCNLKSSDIIQKDFQSSLALIRKTFRTNQPLLVRMEETPGKATKPRAILCIPVGLEGRVQGVLYYENSYVKDCFDDVDSSQLVQLTSHLSNLVYSLLAFTRQTEEKSRLLLRESIVLDRPDGMEFLTKNPFMIGLLAQADLMAASEAPVLLLGETGVGKELLAYRLHKVSPRHERPFVIVDATTIPEALVESELFGHEKGAFTGADQKKIGRLTL
jgi:tetratricopeptide (TPR) repeat protein